MKWRKTGLDYAQQTLEQSQDRFAAGVTNNVEVIQAQQQLASANEQYITSLYAHNIAKVLLARAIGNAEQAVKQYLSQPGNVLPANPGNGHRRAIRQLREPERRRAIRQRRRLRLRLRPIPRRARRERLGEMHGGPAGK